MTCERRRDGFKPHRKKNTLLEFLYGFEFLRNGGKAFYNTNQFHFSGILIPPPLRNYERPAFETDIFREIFTQLQSCEKYFST